MWNSIFAVIEKHITQKIAIEVKGSSTLYLNYNGELSDIFGCGADIDSSISINGVITEREMRAIVRETINYIYEVTSQFSDIVVCEGRAYKCIQYQRGTRSKVVNVYFHNLNECHFHDYKSHIYLVLLEGLLFKGDTNKLWPACFDLWRFQTVWIDIDTNQKYHVEHLDLSRNYYFDGKYKSTAQLNHHFQHDCISINGLHYPKFQVLEEDNLRMLKYNRSEERKVKCEKRLNQFERAKSCFEDRINAFESEFGYRV